MSDIDKRLDEILGADIYVKLNDRTPAKIIVTDSIGTHGYHRTYNNVKQAIKQLMADEFEKLIGDDEPVDMSFGRTEDQIIRDTCYTQGVNETKAELRQKLEEWKQ